MRLIHYSSRPLLAVESFPIADQPESFKPKGLWVSVEGPDDWKSWCEAEDFPLSNLALQHEVALSESANILRLSSLQEINRFTDLYIAPVKYHISFIDRSRLDWKNVAGTYDGIIIAPYVWECRLNDLSPWYYSWDCASGCIWNANAVKKIIPVETEVTHAN